MIRAAITLFALTLSTAVAPATTNPGDGLWHNVIESKSGDVYILDYDLTLADCVGVMEGNPGSACELQ